MFDRRSFLKLSGKTACFLGASVAFPLAAFPASEVVKLTVLHTNDVHSRIEPFPMDGSSRQGLGGVARRAQLVKQIRAVEENVLLLDSGDIFQGTPYFNVFGGELEFKLMTEMGYDAATIGNHDFDAGLEGLVNQLPHASFPLLSSNYDFIGTPMNGKTLPHKVFVKGGMRIGVFGIGIKLDGLVPPKLFGNTQYLDPVKHAQAQATFLKKEENCDYVICLSHLGYRYEGDKISDIALAQQTRDIDLILGGHTHTFMDKPDSQANLDGETVLINQAGWGGIMLGRMDIYFERNKKRHCTACKNLVVNQ